MCGFVRILIFHDLVTPPLRAYILFISFLLPPPVHGPYTYVCLLAWILGYLRAGSTAVTVIQGGNPPWLSNGQETTIQDRAGLQKWPSLLLVRGFLSFRPSEQW